MTHILIALFTACSIFLGSSAHASTTELARELHIALNSVDRETIPNQMALQFIQLRPELRSKEQELKRVVLDILDSKEYENIRAEYFSKAFNEKELKEQIALVRSPAFKLYQKKTMEMIQFSGTALMQLAQNKFSQLEKAPKKSESVNPSNNRKTFYSEDYGNLFISTWLYFDQETERLYRLNFSSKIQGSEYSIFLVCAARKFASTNGFDGWVISSDNEDKQRGMIGFLKKGENTETVLGTRFTTSPRIEVDNENIAPMCIKGEEQARARNTQIPNTAIESPRRAQ